MNKNYKGELKMKLQNFSWSATIDNAEYGQTIHSFKVVNGGAFDEDMINVIVEDWIRKQLLKILDKNTKQ